MLAFIRKLLHIPEERELKVAIDKLETRIEQVRTDFKIFQLDVLDGYQERLHCLTERFRVRNERSDKRSQKPLKKRFGGKSFNIIAGD
jgi:hypothetical protein